MAEELTSIEAARELVLGATKRLSAEGVPLRAALGRFLAETVRAVEDVPGFENSAMDGYAVRSEDVAGAQAGDPRSLAIVGESRAGHPAAAVIAAGEAIAISTGAMVPGGADAVIRVEDTSREGERLLVHVPAPVGDNIRHPGEDVRGGTELLGPGVELGAAEIGLLAAVGRAEVLVARRPRISVLCTGDELVEPGAPMGPGQIRNSNAYSIPPLASGAGAEVISAEIAADDPEATAAALERGMDADVAVVCGGVSVGDHDHVRPALEALGVEQVFWRVSLRPGKPTYFGVGPSGALVFGLPGNPVSAMVTSLLFVRPALLAMQGADPSARRIVASMGVDLETVEGRAEAVRVRLEAAEHGWIATPTGPQGSHVLTSMLGADGLAFAPSAARVLHAGEPIEVELLRWG